jgi:hypothetical protein
MYPVHTLQQRLPGTQTVVVKGEWLTWYGMRMPLAIAGLRQLRERLELYTYGTD